MKIESVSHSTILSIILDTALSWKFYINMIAIKYPMSLVFYKS